MPTIDPAQIEAQWVKRDKMVQGEYIREGMRRHPDDLEKAYQWAYDRIQKRNNPPSPADLYREPVPYKGTI